MPLGVAAPVDGRGVWRASWITHKGYYAAPGEGLFLFRRTFTLSQPPKEGRLWISADNLYRLWVNGERIGHGPVHGVPERWSYDCYDLTGHWHIGDNEVIAEVAWYGSLAPSAIEGAQLGLLVAAENETLAAHLNTGTSWQVTKVPGFDWLDPNTDKRVSLIIAGPGERIEGAYVDPDNRLGVERLRWISASPLCLALEATAARANRLWQMVPRTIPRLHETVLPDWKIRRVTGEGVVANPASLKKEPLIVPANTTATVLIDVGQMTTAFVDLTTQGGGAGSIRLVYAEGLFDDDGNKGERGEIAGRHALGLTDQLQFGEETIRLQCRSIAYRAFRFIEIHIQAKSRPVELHSLSLTETCYPFSREASFRSSDPALEKIFQAALRTTRLCSHDTFVDCPYYERLQYFGDLSISAIVSAVLGNDTRLLRQAIVHQNESRNADGTTPCCYPPHGSKVIPAFCLIWVTLLREHTRLTGDLDFARSMLADLSLLCRWAESLVGDDDLWGPVPYWNFVDCTEDWPWDQASGSVGEPDGTLEGGSAVSTLQHVLMLQHASELYAWLGESEERAKCCELEQRLSAAVRDRCWDADRGWLATTPQKSRFTEHANILALAVGLFEDGQAREMAHRLAGLHELTPASLQLRGLLHGAIRELGLANNYLGLLGPWRQLIEQGFTTFPEYAGGQTRSDCHQWLAYPALELMRTVAGINYVGMGRKRVRINPALGELDWVEACLPTPYGKLEVSIKRGVDGTSKTTVQAPDGLSVEVEPNQ